MEVFHVKIDKNVTVIVPHSTKAELYTEGFNEHVKFFNDKGDIVGLYKLSAIEAFFKTKPIDMRMTSVETNNGDNLLIAGGRRHGEC